MLGQFAPTQALTSAPSNAIDENLPTTAGLEALAPREQASDAGILAMLNNLPPVPRHGPTRTRLTPASSLSLAERFARLGTATRPLQIAITSRLGTLAAGLSQRLTASAPALPTAQRRLPTQTDMSGQNAGMRESQLAEPQQEAVMDASSANVAIIRALFPHLQVPHSQALVETTHAASARMNRVIQPLAGVSAAAGMINTFYQISTGAAASGAFGPWGKFFNVVAIAGGGAMSMYTDDRLKATNETIEDLAYAIERLTRDDPVAVKHAADELASNPLFQKRTARDLFHSPERLEIFCNLFSESESASSRALKELKMDSKLNSALEINVDASEIDIGDIEDGTVRSLHFWDALYSRISRQER